MRRGWARVFERDDTQGHWPLAECQIRKLFVPQRAVPPCLGIRRRLPLPLPPYLLALTHVWATPVPRDSRCWGKDSALLLLHLDMINVDVLWSQKELKH